MELLETRRCLGTAGAGPSNHGRNDDQRAVQSGGMPIFVGGLGTQARWGAITVAFPRGQVVVGFGAAVRQRRGVLPVQAAGTGGPEKCQPAASTAPVQQHIFVGALVIFCCVIWLEPILGRLGGERQRDAVRAQLHGNLYRLLHFNVFNVTMNNIVSSEGAAKTTMCVARGRCAEPCSGPIFIYGAGFRGGRSGQSPRDFTVLSPWSIWPTIREKTWSVFRFSIKGFPPVRQHYVGDSENWDSNEVFQAAD